MKASNDNAETLRRYPLTWRILGCAFQRIPLFSLAKSLADRKFMVILQQTLKALAAKRKSGEEDVEAPSSKKRKRTNVPEFKLAELRTKDGCLLTGDAVLSSLRILLDRLQQTSHLSPNDNMGAEHIKALFSQPASEVVTNAVSILSLCDDSTTSDMDLSLSQESWIATLASIWNMRLRGHADALELAMFASRSAFGLLGRLMGFNQDLDVSLDSRTKAAWVQQLQSFLHRNLMLPAKAAFANRQDIEILTRSIDVAKGFASVSVPVFFRLATTTPRLLAGPSASKVEDEWTREVFKLAESGSRKLSPEVRSSVLRTILKDALANGSSIDPKDLRQVCERCALGTEDVDWQLVSLIAQCDPDVFLLSDEGASLLDSVAALLGEARAGSQSEADQEAVSQLVNAIISGFENARDLPTFLKKWYDLLSSCDRESLPAEDRPVWFTSATCQNPRLIAAVERSMAPRQLLDVLRYVEDQGVSHPEAILVFLDTLACSLSSDDFTDAIGMNIFSLAQNIWSQKVPGDIRSLRWRIASKTISWADFEGSTAVWNDIQTELTKVVQKGSLDDPETFQAFQCAGNVWLSFYPDGPAESVLSDLLCSFADRLSKHIKKAEPNSTDLCWNPRHVQLGPPNVNGLVTKPTTASYVDYALGFATRLLPLLGRKAEGLPSFVERILAVTDRQAESPESEKQLANTLISVLSNETVYHEQAFAGRFLDYVIDCLEQGSKSSPWTDIRPAAALKALASAPEELLSRQQRERIMEILLTQRRKMKSKGGKLSSSTWSLVLGLMNKMMRKPTFYSSMALEDLTALASSVAPVVPDMDSSSALGASRLIYELSVSTVRQMHDHFEEWGAEYFKVANRHLAKDPDGVVDNMTLFVLKAIVEVLSTSESTKVQGCLDLEGIQKRLVKQAAVSIEAFVQKQRSSEPPTEDAATVNELLLALAATEGLPSALLRKPIGVVVMELEEASRKAIDAGLIRGWKIRSFLIRHFAGQVSDAQPVDLEFLFNRVETDGIDQRTMPDSLAAFNPRETLEDCVDAVISHLGQRERLAYAERLVGDLQGGEEGDGNLLAIHRVLGQVTEEPSSQGSGSFDLATAHSKLAAHLTTASTAQEFCMTAEVIYLLLDQKAGSMTQWNIETTMSVVSMVSSSKAGIAHSPNVFTSLCKLVSIVIRRHRVRLEDHYHILLTTMEPLLRALVYNTSPSRGTGPSGLKAKHATQYARLVTLVTEPSAASVSRAQHVGALDSAADAAKRTAGRHVYLILMLYVKLQLEVEVSRDVQEALEPGMNSIFDVTPPEVRKILNDAMDASGRAILREMFKRYAQFGKWSGV